jgi:hypothetical protein
MDYNEIFNNFQYEVGKILKWNNIYY